MNDGEKTRPEDTPPEEEENFAQMLESYTDRMSETLRVGDQVNGKILSISDESVFVDTGTKIDGAVDAQELLDGEGNLPYAVGDDLTLFVVAASESEIRLSRAMTGAGGVEELQQARQSGIPVQGKVIETCKGGFRVETMHRKAFCPVSQMDLRYVDNPEAFVGETYDFLIERIANRGRNIVVSRRRVLEREQEAAVAAFRQTAAEGDVLEGTVTRIMPYGAFVELVPGVEGMVHVSELGWSRVGRPEDVVQTGERIRVQIKSIETDPESAKMKISLSRKQLQSDPWENIGEKVREGDRLQGTVTRCVDFGAFVEIFPGVEGLVHVSEMSYVRRVNKPEDVVHAGQLVSVAVKEVDAQRRRISLSIRDAEGDPWAQVADKYTVGRTVTGTVEKRQPFGLFVRLEPGITGLLPKSKLHRFSDPGRIESLKEGERLVVVVEEINPADRKITLGPGDAQEAGDWQRYSPSSGEGGRSMGLLAEKLQQAMHRKERKK
jgi:small subunit ribosomal protein S1